MSKFLLNNLSDMRHAQPTMLATKELLAYAMAPVYRVINGLLIVTVFMVVGLWLSGNGTNAGPFDMARILVPDEARHMVWSNGFDILNQYKDSSELSSAQTADTEIAAVIYNKPKRQERQQHQAWSAQSSRL